MSEDFGGGPAGRRGKTGTARVRRPRVVYWSNIPSPYVVARYNALARRGNLDFEAWFNERREADRSWEVDESRWEFTARYIRPRRLGRHSFWLPLAEIREVRPDVVVSSYDRASFVLGFAAGRAAATRSAFRCMPNFDGPAASIWWREVAKHILFRGVDGAKVPGEDGRILAERYGLPKDRVTPVTQSIDVEHYELARSASPERVAEWRRALGLRGCAFVYVGRLLRRKGLDQLLDAYGHVVSQFPHVSLLLVGDGADEGRYRDMARDLPGVVFSGFVQARDMPSYYALADVMVFPTLGDAHGLVVDEAMAAGLPVISSDAAGDIRRRVPPNAGSVVAAGDTEWLGREMLRFATNQEMRRRMAAAARSLIRSETHGHDCWAQDFESFVHALLSVPARDTVAARSLRLLGAVQAAAWQLWREQPAPIVSAQKVLPPGGPVHAGTADATRAGGPAAYLALPRQHERDVRCTVASARCAESSDRPKAPRADHPASCRST